MQTAQVSVVVFIQGTGYREINCVDSAHLCRIDFMGDKAYNLVYTSLSERKIFRFLHNHAIIMASRSCREE